MQILYVCIVESNPTVDEIQCVQIKGLRSPLSDHFTQQKVRLIECKLFLTWASVTRCAVTIGAVAALAGPLLVALQNVVALVRGTEVPFFEYQTRDSCAA